MPAREIVALLALVAGILGPSASGWAYEPEMNYKLHCMGCHTPDGSGVPDRVPSMRETLVPFAAQSEGRRYLVQVPGSAQSTLSDAELAQLLNWMIDSLSATRGTFVPFTTSEVSQYRRHSLLDVRGTRERLLRTLAK